MSPKTDEYDVFRIPHSRMMQLVNSCNKNLNVTDFANNDALLALLTNLHNVFKEFKSHEDIENEHIMKQLKLKLKAMEIYNSAVCNCHKDDEFTPLMKLVETGYLFINKSKTTSERINYGITLRKALNKFTNIFIPHMKEEEEIFQPLLLKYFSLGELSEMKNIVIKLHIQQRKRFVGTKLENNKNVLIKTTISAIEKPLHLSIATNNQQVNSINDFPNEIMLKIFANLSFRDKFKCSQVSRKWNCLIYDKLNWKELNFNDWKPANFSNNSCNKPNHQNSGLKDIEYLDDETDEEFENETEIATKEVRILQFWIKSLLPKVGCYLIKLNISNCKSLNNNLTRRILQLCPNLNSLDLSYTKVGDNSFRGVRLDKLNYINFEGCDKLSDNTFKFLLISSLKPIKNAILNKYESQFEDIRNVRLNIEELINEFKNKTDDSDENDIESIKHDKNTKNISNGLNSINLSGCWSITDFGLSYIASKYDLNNLEYLNLSGCLNLTPLGLKLFIDTSDLLTGENFYYCDNILDGPMRSTANGCDNIECGKKFCCRNIN